jgi:protein-L-isoaspartate(D-aspartate) O-methyltransferase
MVDFVQARRMMIDTQVMTSGVTDRRLLTAMANIPREMFVPESRRELAYTDAPHRVLTDSGVRHLAAPAPFAKLVQLADVEHQSSVLDVGCTTGYSAAVLGHLAAKVVAIENDGGLAAAARENLNRLGLTNVEVVSGPLLEGAPDKGPYDVILVEGAIESPPESLFQQLKVGGNLVCLLRSGPAATAYLYTRSASDIAGTPSFNTSLPPLFATRREEAFVF